MSSTDEVFGGAIPRLYDAQRFGARNQTGKLHPRIVTVDRGAGA
jgi:hypothetical protein